MRRPWLLASSVLIVGLTWCASGRAGLEGDPATFDAGEVHAGASLSHRFTVTNRGSEPAEIIDARPSCGCVTASPDRRRFGPGESGSLLLSVNTLTRPDGPASWGVTLRCRVGDRMEETTLTLTAQVRADLSLEPSALVVETDGALERTVVLTDRRAAAMTVKVETSCPKMTATVDAPRRPDGGPWTYSVRLEAPADLPDGRYDETLHLYTSDPEYPDLKMSFTVVKRDRQRVSATPAVVELTAASPSRLVLLRGVDDVEIGGVDPESKAVTCEWAAGSRPTVPVRVRIDTGQAPADGLKTTIHVHLIKPAGQTVDVPVSWSPR